MTADAALSVSQPAVFLDGRVRLYAGDCLAVLKALPAQCADSVVSDPPYHLTSIVKRFGPSASGHVSTEPRAGATGAYARADSGFMGQAWDGGDIAFRPDLWSEVLRVLKPGGHLLAFSGTRTYHRMACAIEDAGFEIRDLIADLVASDAAVETFLASLDGEQRAAFAKCLDESRFGGMLAWVYGQGFPKSHDVSKGIDKMGGVWRGRQTRALPDEAQSQSFGTMYERESKGEPVSKAAQEWDGWGTALKPALEPICFARKPLGEKTIVANVLKHGTGAINVDGCRVGEDERSAAFTSFAPCSGNAFGAAGTQEARRGTQGELKTYHGRWPANVVHDGSNDVLSAFPDAPGQLATVGPQHGTKPSVNVYGDYGPRDLSPPRGDSGSAARFFYSAKADADDRLGSKHPTVKPVGLMQWLVRLVTPPGGLVLDPFAGTGTTGEAAFREGLNAILIEREAPYRVDIARRMALCREGPLTRKHESVKARAASKDVSRDDGPLFGGADVVAGGGRQIYGVFADEGASGDRRRASDRRRPGGEG